ncbi:MAG TPA: N-acetyl-gamma-glutamyl-phosphate reductase [Gemmatimonadales bacterium]
MKVAVVGAAGYAGGELLRLVLQHPDITEVTATSRSQAGVPIADHHPALALLTDARFAAHDPVAAARGRDVVFLALDHGESTSLMGNLVDCGPGMIVDLAADFRIHDGRLHEQHYGPHKAPSLVHRFAYGLADVHGTALRGAVAIAAPGCFATAAQLPLYGIADLPLAGAPVVFAVTGSSGAGAKPKAPTHHPERAHNMFAYAPLGHRHEGEILEQWRTWRGDPMAHARLLCHSGPFVRGIHATLHATLSAPVPDVNAHIAARFAGHPFVRVLSRPPQLTEAVGSNLALLHAAQSPDGREIEVLCVIDNLIKGAGGQAVQAMNLALGLDERTGLTAPGVFPC